MKKAEINPEIKEQIFTMHKNIKYLRVKNALTTKQLAEIIEISENKLMRAEACTDAECFYDKHIRNVCIYFNISADILLNEQVY